MCEDGWLQGWHERNAGNLTYRMMSEDIEQCMPFFDASADAVRTPREWVKMGVTAENLAGEYFITTGTGKFFRNVPLDPSANIGILEISDIGDSYRVVWGLDHDALPTSEIASHLLNHGVRKTATCGTNRVIYHAHPSAIIALTYVLPPDSRTVTRALWQNLTECIVVFPEGVGVLPWMMLGSDDIARASASMMERHTAVVWAQHGMFASGPDFDLTFGLMHTIEKAADIYLRVHSGNLQVRQTITDDQLRAIVSQFKLSVPIDYLE
jgi:rhamnulose-1-phosphate aldolase